MQPPILYSFRRCPYAMRARMALGSAGIPGSQRRDHPMSRGRLNVFIERDHAQRLEALAATNEANARITETVIANHGMTLTPSSTPTITPTFTASPTREVTPTPLPPPSDTLTPTYVSLLTSTPA